MMESQLKRPLVDTFVQSFHANCLLLIGDAYAHLRQKCIVNIDFDEEQTSAGIFMYIEETSRIIRVADEQRLYDEDVKTGKKKAKNVPRIDLVFSIWQENRPHHFWVEAKNLIENDCQKSGRKTLLKANKNHRDYIELGIDRFTSEKYPQPGCMLGYVLEGQPLRIADKINAVLCDSGREAEQLSNDPKHANYYFNSSHSNGFILGHYWLDFTRVSERV